MVAYRPLAKSVQDFLARLARQNPINLVMDAKADCLSGELATRLSVETGTGHAARILLRRIEEVLKPYIDTVLPGTVLRLAIHVSPDPKPVPVHTMVPAVSAAFDAERGHIHHLYSTADRQAVRSSRKTIPIGLTILCQPANARDEKWTQELGAGSNLYTEEEYLRLQAKEASALAASGKIGLVVAVNIKAPIFARHSHIAGPSPA